jgi:hypothetical protein
MSKLAHSHQPTMDILEARANADPVSTCEWCGGFGYSLSEEAKPEVVDCPECFGHGVVTFK